MKYVKVPQQDIDLVEEARKNIHNIIQGLNIPEIEKAWLVSRVIEEVTGKMFKLTHRKYKKVVLF